MTKTVANKTDDCADFLKGTLKWPGNNKGLSIFSNVNNFILKQALVKNRILLNGTEKLHQNFFCVSGKNITKVCSNMRISKSYWIYYFIVVATHSYVTILH